MGEDQALDALREPRPIGDVDFEIAPPLVDEVVADVRGPIGGCPLAAACRALSTAFSATRNCASPLGARELFDGLALPIAAEEVHPAVGAGGIALQHLFDQADRLEVLAPVERGAQTQAGDGIGDRDLVGGLRWCSPRIAASAVVSRAAR